MNSCHAHAMVGGKGWDNNSFLDSLGGNPQDREQSQQDYNNFKETREAFAKRQQERFNTPEGQRFMQQQKAQMQSSQSNQDPDSNLDEPLYRDVGASSGGSAYRKMMQRSQEMKQRMNKGGATSFIDPMTGMEQSYAVPLESEEQE
jgi:DNA repair ATPase RecN